MHASVMQVLCKCYASLGTFRKSDNIMHLARQFVVEAESTSHRRWLSVLISRLVCFICCLFALHSLKFSIFGCCLNLTSFYCCSSYYYYYVILIAVIIIGVIAVCVEYLIEEFDSKFILICISWVCLTEV